MTDEFRQFHEAAIADATEVYGEPFFYNGATYSGIITDVGFTSDLLSGGLMEQLATVILVSKAVLPLAPTVGKTVKVGDRTLRVTGVKTDTVSTN